MTAAGGGNLGTEPTFATVIAADMRRLDPATRKAVRPKLRLIGEQLRSAAAANASWSTRIPGAMSIEVSFRANREGIRLRVDQAKAPHARPYEGMTSGGSFRHPVFGTGDRQGFWTKDTFVSQATRPFMLPAAVAVQPAASQLILAAIDEASAEIGAS